MRFHSKYSWLLTHLLKAFQQLPTALCNKIQTPNHSQKVLHDLVSQLSLNQGASATITSSLLCGPPKFFLCAGLEPSGPSSSVRALAVQTADSSHLSHLLLRLHYPPSPKWFPTPYPQGPTTIPFIALITISKDHHILISAASLSPSPQQWNANSWGQGPGPFLTTIPQHITRYLLNTDPLNKYKARGGVWNTMLDETAPMCHTATEQFK